VFLFHVFLRKKIKPQSPGFAFVRKRTANKILFRQATLAPLELCRFGKNILALFFGDFNSFDKIILKKAKISFDLPFRRGATTTFG